MSVTTDSMISLELTAVIIEICLVRQHFQLS